ncbi:MAG: hypothetical protein FD123_1006 [Bacteroidetes bacterium]|nr:MAG: hypothetical protein FD123_1006 [Bacteroidota bacterium]
MFGKLFGKKKNTVLTTFTNAETGEVIGRAEMPPENLPADFGRETTFSIQGGEWTVESADPLTAEEYIRKGKLTVKLRRIQYVNPNDILMTLPTISNELPPVSENPPFKNFSSNMHEDDWRQEEFLARSLLVEVEEELDAVRDIFENHSRPIGESSMNAYTKLHVRNRVPEPLRGINISLDELRSLLGDPETGSLTFSTSNGKPYGFVSGGFVLKMPEDCIVYGLVRDNHVSVIGLHGDDPLSESVRMVLCEKFRLLHIDWVRAEMR